MKIGETYRITAVRLVEFHNLGTTTVELPRGGHLFLLGDNGSGKTTLLDAVHLVLTAGREMELNSAARVAGAKDSGGRTIQGIVLRYNAVTGRTAREAGITYAAVELKSDTGKTFSLAVGLSAEGMDVRHEKWGGIASVPVGELPLTVEEEGKLRAATQAEFKQRMAPLRGGRYFSHIGDYAEAVGERFFGGKEKFSDVCKLLRTGKAYREIAAKASNYDELFRQLLEGPSRETFEPLLKGLRELEESKGKLDNIELRSEYLKGLKRESERLDRARLEAALIDWSRAARELAECEEEMRKLGAAIEEAKKELETKRRERDEANAEEKRQAARLAELQAKDGSGLLRQEQAKAARLEQLERVKSEAAMKLAARKTELAAARKTLQKTNRAWRETLQKRLEGVLAAAKGTGVQVGLLADRLGAMAAAGCPEEAQKAAPDWARFRQELREQSEARYGEKLSAGKRLEAAQEECGKRRRELEELRAMGENLPGLPGFKAMRDEIRMETAGSARCVYELLEPAGGCDSRSLARIERLAGEEFLSTWVVDARDADRVRKILWREETEFSLAVRGTEAAGDVETLAPWLGRYVSFEESDPEAVRLLARHLAAATGPEADKFLERQIWRFRTREGLEGDGRARLIGVRARAEEHARREKAAEARLAEAEKSEREAAKALSEAEKALERIKELEGKIEAVQSECGAMLFGFQRDFDAVARAEETCARESESANEKARDAAEAKEELDDLRILMKESGIDGQLAQRIESAKRAVERAEKRKNALAEETGAVGGRLRSLEGGFDAKRIEAENHRERLAFFGTHFSGKVPEGGTAEDYVRSVLPKCMEADADLQEMHEKAVADARVAESEIARRVRDVRGEAYSFSFDRERNLLKDRRGGTIDEVLADETVRLEELRGMINTKSREIFERIFMGEVMKRLYLDLLQLEDLARRIRTKLAGRQFGTNRYAFDIAPVAEYEGFVELVRNYSRLDSAGGKDELREYMELHRDAIMESDIDAVPDVFDYRKWFRFELKVLTENEDGRVIDRRLKSMGSGGEQAVPNYLLILAVAEFLYHAGDSAAAPKLAPLLFDEAFYGIDAARRDQLLALADDLGLQLFVSSPDQDGVKREIKNSVSLIVVKDENLDVHLSPVIWRNEAVQGDLLGGGEEKPGMTVEWGDESPGAK